MITIAIDTEQKFSQRTCHIEIRKDFFKDYIENGMITL